MRNKFLIINIWNMAENKTMGQAFVDKYTGEEADKYLYEYKTGEFSRGEVIGMMPLAVQCPNTKFNYAKDTTQEYTEVGEFISQGESRETDLQIPVCGNC